MRPASLARAVLSFVGCAISEASPPQYQIYDLGASTTAQTTSYATGLNASGVVVGWRYTPLLGHSNDEGYRALTWNPGMQMLAVPPGADGASAISVNSAGVIAGYQDTASRNHAVLWSGGPPQSLAFPGVASEATSINDSNQVAGNYTTSLNPVTIHGFVWSNGSYVDIGGLGGSRTIPKGINNHGLVAGIARNGAVDKAFSWQNGQLSQLPDLGGRAFALAVNDQDSIGGWVASGPSSSIHLPALWQSGVLSTLPTLPGDSNGTINAINGGGVAVGDCSTPGEVEASMWMDGQVYSLLSLVPANSGWYRLYDAYAINDQGWIAGYGRLGNVGNSDHAFLMVPVPAPAAAALLGLAGLIASRRRR